MMRAAILDLDGTVYVGPDQVPGAADFVRTCHAQGIRTLFVTNRTNRTPEAVRDHLRGYDIACETDDILTASQATAAFLDPGKAYVIGEEALVLELTAQGFCVTPETDAPDYVIVSYDRNFSYDKLRAACHWIAQGATFIATNPDRALPFMGTCLPGTGAIVAAVEAGSATEPVVIGKPERHIMDMALGRLQLPADDVVAIGDNLATDIAAGAAANLRTVLLLTGVSGRDDVAAAPHAPTWIAEDYAAATKILLAPQAAGN